MGNSIVTFEFLQRFQHGADWRWKLAQRGAAGSASHVLLDADDLVKEAVDYIGLLAPGDGQEFLAVRRHPQLHAAVGLWQDPLLQARLKILVLGDCTAAEITARLGLGEEAIKTAEALFLDVRQQLSACDWVCAAVIMEEERAGNTDLATHLRMAYFGGPLIAHMVLDTLQRIPADKADRLYHQSIMLHVKASQALAVPLRDQASVLKYLKMFMDYKVKTQRLDLEREKFRHRCEQEVRRQQETDPLTETVATEEPITQTTMSKVA